MVKDILAVLGVDGAASMAIYLIDPSFLRWVLGLGLASLIAFVFLRSKEEYPFMAAIW